MKSINEQIYSAIACYWDDDMRYAERNERKALKCEYLFNRYILQKIESGTSLKELKDELEMKQTELEKNIVIKKQPSWLNTN